jgi:hypothetical protein
MPMPKAKAPNVLSRFELYGNKFGVLLTRGGSLVVKEETRAIKDGEIVTVWVDLAMHSFALTPHDAKVFAAALEDALRVMWLDELVLDALK